MLLVGNTNPVIKGLDWCWASSVLTVYGVLFIEYQQVTGQMDSSTACNVLSFFAHVLCNIIYLALV